ncbi:MAG: hypothetical protein LQ349_006528 [Xanthoria aureola]|nr:MAG: hypothetical protein LQ349_006528 [Xanthoria aureola]
MEKQFQPGNKILFTFAPCHLYKQLNVQAKKSETVITMVLPSATSLFDMSCEHSGPKLSSKPLLDSISRSSGKPGHGAVKLRLCQARRKAYVISLGGFAYASRLNPWDFGYFLESKNFLPTYPAQFAIITNRLSESLAAQITK